MRVCKFCKTENADEAKFCVNCGKDLNSEPEDWFAIIGGFGVLCFALYSIFDLLWKLLKMFTN